MSPKHYHSLLHRLKVSYNYHNFDNMFTPFGVFRFVLLLLCFPYCTVVLGTVVHFHIYLYLWVCIISGVDSLFGFHSPLAMHVIFHISVLGFYL